MFEKLPDTGGTTPVKIKIPTAEEFAFAKNREKTWPARWACIMLRRNLWKAYEKDTNATIKSLEEKMECIPANLGADARNADTLWDPDECKCIVHQLHGTHFPV